MLDRVAVAALQEWTCELSTTSNGH